MPKKNIALVMGEFHKTKIQIMRDEALEVAKKLQLNVAQEIWVPGSIEKPLALKKVLAKNNIDGVAVLGIIERGETKHGLVMGQAVTNAIIQLQLETMKPIGLGILGPEILDDQIDPRLKPYAKKAIEAVNTMLRLDI